MSLSIGSDIVLANDDVDVVDDDAGTEIGVMAGESLLGILMLFFPFCGLGPVFVSAFLAGSVLFCDAAVVGGVRRLLPSDDDEDVDADDGSLYVDLS